MQVKNNYNECITNLACSIQKYFGLEYSHNTLEYIDKILDERKPKNVVTILLDGLGTNILFEVLGKDSFLASHMVKSITTVFPATTVAATTSIRTGLNPIETGMLGWDMYFKELDKTISVFRYTEKTDENKIVLNEAIEYEKKYMKTKGIADYLNENGLAKGYTLNYFRDGEYKDLREFFEDIEKKCNEPDKTYIYAYNDEPDHLMHHEGTYSKEVRDTICYLDMEIERLSQRLKDTVIFVVADHGHIPVKNVYLEDYPDIVECLKRDTSIEHRAVNFFIKENMQGKFVLLFNKYFGDAFDLYTKDEIIESKIFGTCTVIDGKSSENVKFKDSLGDFLAIAKSNIGIMYGIKKNMKSNHAGYTDDEIYVPLIVI